MRTPRRFLRSTAATLAALAIVAGAARAGGDLHPVEGVNAMPNVAQVVDGHLEATFRGPTKFDVALTERWRSNGKPVTRYDADMTKLMHMIVISDDLRHFQHVHPAIGKNGRATIALDVPALGPYEIYADAVPHGAGQQVLRFKLFVGGRGVKTDEKDLAPTPATVAAGPYAVSLDSLKLAAGSTTMLAVHIAEHGHAARNLHPYLGGAAHAVFIDASDYSYVHVHPMQGTDMSMGAMDMGAERALPDSAGLKSDMMLHVRVPKAGTYKLWLQFRGGSGLYVAPFILKAA
ncbi:MAG: hypothetical protein GIW95_12000 [Candidatus Eremiobacteraeota bacterium]|nr:hypothetical protein [Candidatus Eremiobacteraeota bacterium]